MFERMLMALEDGRLVDRQVVMETETAKAILRAAFLHADWLEHHPWNIHNTAIQCIQISLENIHKVCQIIPGPIK